MNPTVLILTDDIPLRDLLLSHLRPYSVDLNHESASSIESADFEDSDLVVLELPNLAKAAQWTQRIKSDRPQCQILLLTPGDDPPNPEDLEAWGVRTWLGKPVEPERILDCVERAVQSLAHRAHQGPRMPRRNDPFGPLLGDDPTFNEVLDMAEKAARGENTTVLLLGETGTGKQLLARAIHDASPRAEKPFLDLNCAAIPTHLVESELFGHEPGAFTGAKKQKMGLLEVADRGTVFLDEIGELDLALQVKLLKFLDQREFRRVSGLKLIKVDVRLITATNRDLEREVQQGRFREDLFHRLNVLALRLPPLRERTSDISLLANHFLRLHARRCGAKVRELSPEAQSVLRGYPWPGNIRELSHVMERSVLLHGEKERLDTGELPKDLTPDRRDPSRPSEGERIRIVAGEGIGEPGGIEVNLPDRPVPWDTIERAILEAALSKAAGNVSEAARLLGLGRGQLRYRMKRLDVKSGGPKRYRPQRRMKRRRARQQAA